MKRWTAPTAPPAGIETAGIERRRSAAPSPTTLWSLAPPASRSLAGLRPGDQARVGRIVFEMVRSRCWEAGISEGATVHCQDNGEGGILVTVADRPVTRLDPDCARFVEITPL